MSKILEIAQGISQVLANAYDGATDSEGKKIEIGLKREEGDPVKDSRIMDGFSANIMGDVLRISYHTECKLKQTHDSKFENEIEMMIEKVRRYLTSEYKSLTGKALSLADHGECEIMVEYISRIRTSVRACKHFKIRGTGIAPVGENSEERLDSTTKRWLELGGLK